MSRIMGITIPAGLELSYNKTLKMYASLSSTSVGKNPRFVTRSRGNTLKNITYLFDISQNWSNFSDSQKQDWQNAGNVCGLNGYNLFVQDQAYRIKNLIDDFATPSLFHQFLVGHINLTGNTNSLIIKQTGSVAPNFPLTFQLSRKSNLTSLGSNSYAKLVLKVNRIYNNQNFTDENSIDIPLSDSWAIQTLGVELPLGIPQSWELSLELNNVAGDLWFDNIWVFYNGVINNNDSKCEAIDNSWDQVLIPDEAIIESIYPMDEAL